MEPTREHPLTFELECYHANVLDDSLRRSVHQHVESCETCRAYLDELESEREALQRRKPPVEFARKIMPDQAGERTGWWMLRAPRWALAAAAGLVLLAASLVWVHLSEQSSVRLMGAGEVLAYLKHDGVVRKVEHSATIRAGDSVRFELTVSRPGFVTVFFLDVQGRVSWYLPADDRSPPLRVEGGKSLLPGSARFDAAEHAERAFVYFRPHGYRPADIARRVRKAWLDSGSSDFSEDAWLSPFDNLTSILFVRP